MYGLLLESLSNFIKLNWGEEGWEAVRRHAGVEPTFCIHQIYAETLIPKLTKSAVQVLGVAERELFEAMGVYFVEFVGLFGYGPVMSVLGRHMRDFLNGLDNLHEYLKFSYPKMRAPSFFCEKETSEGMILHYRSKRQGFVFYTIGQIKQVAKRFYDTDCQIDLLSEEIEGNGIHVTFGLKFDNRAFIRDKTESLMTSYQEEQLLPFRTSKLFELFPFCIVFSRDMVIRHTGFSLVTTLKDLVGQYISENFDLVKPTNLVMTFLSILERQNNTFELVTTTPIHSDETIALRQDESGFGKYLRLRGQMLYMEDWKCIMFLATPVMPDLDSLMAAGLFINDLSLHDCSRDFVLAGTQQSVELKLALHQEQLKTQKLEESMRKLDDEMKRTDELLYQMIPKQVADRIRCGENPVNTCKAFDAVSILFSDVVTFTEICSRISPMLVVSMLNHMYSLFDQLTEKNGVYKVETIGDSYMVVSGAPNQEINHAERICDMAMDMIDASKGIYDPSRDGEHLKLRVGIHSGNVVAGVVGLKMPRYCLFGDTVNTSSRMESSSEVGKIQISSETKGLLPPHYETLYRGEIPIKGKGKMVTYWLINREGRVPLSQLECSAIIWAAPAMGVYSSKNTADIRSNIYSIPSAIMNDTPNLIKADGTTRTNSGRITSKIDQTDQSYMGKTVLRTVKEVMSCPLYNYKKSTEKHEQHKAINPVEKSTTHSKSCINSDMSAVEAKYREQSKSENQDDAEKHANWPTTVSEIVIQGIIPNKLPLETELARHENSAIVSNVFQSTPSNPPVPTRSEFEHNLTSLSSGEVKCYAAGANPVLSKPPISIKPDRSRDFNLIHPKDTTLMQSQLTPTSVPMCSQPPHQRNSNDFPNIYSSEFGDYCIMNPTNTFTPRKKCENYSPMETFLGNEVDLHTREVVSLSGYPRRITHHGVKSQMCSLI